MLRFNSTTVQLIRESRESREPRDLFQFHNGTINTKHIGIVCPLAFVFQFHNGTINTFVSKPRPASVPKFQFHNGTINTGDILLSPLFCHGFNSTTVQLILCCLKLPKSGPTVFQFHNGTINTINCVYYGCKSALFQFHNGTINTIRRPKLQCSKLCFNSTTVQLIHTLTEQTQCSGAVSIPQRYN